MINLQDTFRHSYADGNPLWKVVKKSGRGVWLCEILNDEDFKGVQKVFMTKEIEASKKIKEFFDEARDNHDKFYSSLNEGDIVHYHNGFKSYVRCKVSSNKELIPIALVGNWQRGDLPNRTLDGTIQYSYYPRQIVDKKAFKPNALNIYENPRYVGKIIEDDPAVMEEINLKLPEPTDQEKENHKLWCSILKIKEELDSSHVHKNEPKKIIDNLKKILENV
jgi:hypothetical protein